MPRKPPRGKMVVEVTGLFLRAFDAGLLCASARHARIPSLAGDPSRNLTQFAEGLKETLSPVEGAMREHLADAVVGEFLAISKLEWDDASVGITALVDLQRLACALAPWRYTPDLIETPTVDRG